MTAEPLACAMAGTARATSAAISVTIRRGRRIGACGPPGWRSWCGSPCWMDTLAIPFLARSDGRERLGDPAGPRGVRVGGGGRRGGGARAGPQGGILAQGAQRAGQRGRVPGGDDQAGALVADEAAGGGSDGVGGDDGQLL